MIPLHYFLILSAVLFALGVGGFLLRRSPITLLLCIELMLQAVTLAFAAFSYGLRQLDGQVFGLFVIVVSVIQAAVGVAIVFVWFRTHGQSEQEM